MSTPVNLGMSQSHQQERFGDAFLLAVASVAGCAYAKPETDNDSIDWTLSCKLSRRPKIDVQIKTTLFDGEFAEMIPYPLKKKNYNDLILTDVLTPRILVLVAVPREIDSWLTVTQEQLVLKRSAYWVSLAGFPESENETTVTVHVSTSQPFTVDGLCRMMHQINEEGTL
ncbi:MAG: DUF4365 domain-containing protein [Terracidiphilus sp.]|jgi:hypothetical protein